MRAHYAVLGRPSSASRHRGWFGVAALVLGSAGCSEATTEQVEGPASVSIAPFDLNLIVNDVATLSAEALDAKRQRIDATFIWSSANTAVATVTSAGVVTAIGPGSTTVTAKAGQAKAAVTITVHAPAVAIFISPGDLVLTPGAADRFTARAVNGLGLMSNVSIEWSSAHPAIATVGKSDGVVTAIAIGSTTVMAAVGSLRAAVNVTVEPENYIAQWASGAFASTQYTADQWSAAQATGVPNVVWGCSDDPLAWASATPDLDWLEVTYAQPVHPTRIHIYENWAVGSIVKVEVKDVAGSYHVVYSALPIVSPSCPQILAIDVTNVTAKVATVRITVDQRVRQDWNEIDAVRLTGVR